MISKLKLMQFGKFQNKEFLLSPVATVFRGDNESGKTTVLDSFLYGFFRLSKRGKEKQISLRYGSSDEVNIDCEWYAEYQSPDHPLRKKIDSLGIAGFKPLSQIREGDMELNIEEASVSGKLQEYLLSDKIDLSKVINEIENSFTSGSKSTTAGKNQIQFQEKLDTAKKKLQEAESKWKTLQENKQKLSEKKSHLQKLNHSLSESKEEVSQLEQKKNLAEKFQTLSKFKKILTLFLNLKKTREYLEKNPSIPEEVIQKVQKWESEVLESKKEAEILSCHLDQKQSQSHETKKKILECESEILKSEPKSKFFEQKWDELNQIGSGLVLNKLVYHWNPILVVLGAFLGALGLASLVFSYLNGILFLGLGIASLTIGLVVVLVWGRSHATVEDRSKEKEYLAKLKTEFQTKYEDRGLEGVSSVEDLRNRLFSLKEKRNEEESKLRILKEASLTEQKERLEIEESLQNSLGKKTTAETELLSLLSRLSVKDAGELHEKKQRFEDSKKEIERTEKEIHELWRELQASPEDLNTIEALSTQKLSQLDEELSGIDTRNLVDRQAIEREFKSSKEKMETLNNTMIQLDKEISSLEGQISGKELEYNDEYNQATKNFRFAHQSWELNQNQKKAGEVVVSIFRQMDSERQTRFLEIANFWNNELAEFLPERKVEVTGIQNIASARMTDAGGNLRGIEHLSRGTQSIFYLTGKLFLAKKIFPEGGLFCMDEPFLHLDQNRTQRAIEILVRFQSENRFQFIFFTKYEWLAKQLTEAFGKEARRIEL